jgi:long-chain acyl-CoA synthetase
MDEPAQVRSGDRARPLTEVKARASRLAAGLRELGVGHGDRYAIVLRNETAFLEATLAAGVIGAVPVPVNWHWTGEDLRHLLHDSASRVVIAHTDLLPAVERHAPDGTTIVEAAVPPEVAAAYGLGDVAPTGRHLVLDELVEAHQPVAEPNTQPPLGVIYTSGTTGLAKGILREPITAETLPVLAKLVGELLLLRPGWRTLEPAPLYHTAPNVHATFAAAFGMDTRIMPRFDPEELLRLVQDERIDTVQLVPTMFTRLLALPDAVRFRYDLSSLKAVVHAAAPCPVPVKRARIEWCGPISHEYYGGSEGGGWTMHDSAEALAHPGTVGRPFLDSSVRILDEQRREVPTGQTGMVYGRSPTGWPQFSYIGNPEGRAAIEADDGFFTIGDIGHLDEEGYLYLSDRAHDMVVAGGVNIYPVEIENCLHSLPGVADVAVFGIPDPDLGETLAAHVEPDPGATLTEDDVRTHVRAHLAAYKVPRVVVFEHALPREETGKLFKRRIRAAYWPDEGPAPEGGRGSPPA